MSPVTLAASGPAPCERVHKYTSMPRPRRVGKILKAPPSCPSKGTQCSQLGVILKVGGMEDGVPSLDHEGTWLLGHTEQIDIGTPRRVGNDLLVDATLHLRCK